MGRRRRPPTTHGVVIVDKPAGITSHDVVDRLRRRFDERRIGHAGTLDPDATGVLVVTVGSATRLVRFIGATTKSYTGEVVLGIETDTLDAAGAVTATHAMPAIGIAEVQRVVDERFVGSITQIPPMVSAVRVDGRRLHELARAGVEVERSPRTVEIERFIVAEAEPYAPGQNQVLAIEVDCSAGTYIRTLAADLGHALGGGAHLRGLRRTAVGPFGVDEAGPPDEAPLLPVADAVRSLVRVDVDAATAAVIANGRVLDAWTGSGPWAVFGPDGELLAVYERVEPGTEGGRAKPAVVLIGR